MFEGNVTIARQILRTVLTERVTFTPLIDGERRAYEIRARLFTGRIYSGLAVPQMVVAPTGFEPVFQS